MDRLRNTGFIGTGTGTVMFDCEKIHFRRLTRILLQNSRVPHPVKVLIPWEVGYTVQCTWLQKSFSVIFLLLFSLRDYFHSGEFFRRLHCNGNSFA
jgi:hypothetical protein